MKRPEAQTDITIAGKEGIKYEREPLTFGVPFAQGALPVDREVHVAAGDGSALPVQTKPLTTWEADGRSVKWLLVDMQHNGSTRPDAPLRIIAVDKSSSSAGAAHAKGL